jgi:hypothetical protein
MLWPGIKKIGRELQLKRTKSEVVGEMENCYVKMYDWRNMKVLELYVPELDDVDKKSIGEKLKSSKIKNYVWLNNEIKITFWELFRPYSINKIKNILIELVEYFSQKYPGRKPKCHSCDTQKKADVYCVGDVPLYLCDDCLRENENKMHEASIEYQQIPTNYFSGFIGALLFSIPGIILTVFLFFLGKLSAISSLAYVFLGIMGYHKFKGKVTPFGVFIIMSVAIIMTGIGVIVSYAMIIFRELESMDFELLIVCEGYIPRPLGRIKGMYPESNTLPKQHTSPFRARWLIEVLKFPEVKKEVMLNLGLAYLVSAFCLVYQFFKLKNEWNYNFNIQKPEEI